MTNGSYCLSYRCAARCAAGREASAANAAFCHSRGLEGGGEQVAQITDRASHCMNSKHHAALFYLNFDIAK